MAPCSAGANRSFVLLAALLCSACTTPPGSPPGDAATKDASTPDASSPPAAADASLDSGEGPTPITDAGADASPVDASRWVPYLSRQAPAENPSSPAKAMLGKILFWDEQLSSDDSVACGTCHRPAAGGADPRPAVTSQGHPGEDGVLGTADDPRGSPGIARCQDDADGGVDYLDDPVFGQAPQVTRRRSMSYMDAMQWPALFWDGRAAGRFEDPQQPGRVMIDGGAALESQAVKPIMDSSEMACEGRDWEAVIAKLQSVRPLALAHRLPQAMAEAVQESSGYPSLFQRAFGSPDISATRIAYALASHERELVSDQTPWDRWAAGRDDGLQGAALRGWQVFVGQGSCNCCHTAPNFGSPGFVDDTLSATLWDLGRQDVTGDPAHAGAFRLVSLRNVGQREAAGLLHDGLPPGGSLEALVHAYSQLAPTRRPAALCRTQLTLTAEQEAELVEFLRHGLSDPRAVQERAPFDRPLLSSE